MASLSNPELLIQRFEQLLLVYGPKVVGAVVVLIAGLWLIRLLVAALGRMMAAQQVDPSLVPFLRGVVGAVLKVGLVISVVQMVGIETTSFIAVLGAAGLAIGMALSGTLQNFAGGVIILLVKPYKVGDFIETQGHMGTVQGIQIFNTVLKTPEGQTVVLPNSPVSTSAILNYSTEPRRRMDLSFRISYLDDIDKAKTTLREMVEHDERVLREPEVLVAVSELAESAVNLKLRFWTTNEDYWSLYFELPERVKKNFDRAGIHIPYPKLDVHMHGSAAPIG